MSQYYLSMERFDHGQPTFQLDSLNRVVFLLDTEKFQIRRVDLLRSVEPVDLAAQIGSLILPMQLDLFDKHSRQPHAKHPESTRPLTSATLYKFF